MGACARNMQSDSAEIKPAQCCIKLVFRLNNIKIYIKTAPTFFGVTVTPSSGSALIFCLLELQRYTFFSYGVISVTAVGDK